MKYISVTYMHLQCPHGDQNKKEVNINPNSSSSSYHSEGTGRFPFKQLPIGGADIERTGIYDLNLSISEHDGYQNK
jgi:hypothetical protein